MLGISWLLIEKFMNRLFLVVLFLVIQEETVIMDDFDFCEERKGYLSSLSA